MQTIINKHPIAIHVYSYGEYQKTAEFFIPTKIVHEFDETLTVYSSDNELLLMLDLRMNMFMIETMTIDGDSCDCGCEECSIEEEPVEEKEEFKMPEFSVEKAEELANKIAGKFRKAYEAFAE